MKKLFQIIFIMLLFTECKKSPVQHPIPPTPKTYTINTKSGGNGSVSVLGSTPVEIGKSVIVEVIPAPGYGIESVLIDSVAVPIQTDYTFSNVTRNHTVSATFGLVYNITITASPNGTASYSPEHVVAGQTVTFTFSPKPNYLTDSLYVGGKFLKVLAGETTFTLTNVTSDQTIAVTFSITTKGIDSLKNLLVGSWHYVQYDYKYDGTTKWIIAPYITDCEKPRHEVYTADNKYTYFLGGTSCDPSYAPTNIYFDGTWKFDTSAKNILIAGNEYTNASDHEYVTGSFTLEKLTQDSLVISYPVPGKSFSYRYHYVHK